MNTKRIVQGNFFGVCLIAMAITAIGNRQDTSAAKSIFTTDGLPPQRGEHIVENYALEFGNQRLEIDGVCKYDSETALCWKPDGSPNPRLTDEIVSAIKSSDQNDRSWRFAIGKKNRTLFLKDIRYNRRGNYNSRYGNVFRPTQASSTFMEGWIQQGGAFGSASQTGFDGSTTNWTTVEGVFNKTTTEFPFRYVFQGMTDKPTIVPLKLGQIDLDGNIVEITAVADHPKDKKAPAGYVYQANYDNPKARMPNTDITFKVISVGNPFSQASVRLADENGNPIDYVDDKGDPVSNKTVNDWYQKNQNQPGQSQKRPPATPFISAGSFYFDPSYFKAGTITQAYVYIPKDKLKKLAVTITRREIYVFDHVKLDPN